MCCAALFIAGAVGIMIEVSEVKQKRKNLFITDREASILWEHSKTWGLKWQTFLGFALFRGLRCGEICAINLRDFQNSNFDKLKVILQKSHILDEFPIMNEFNEIVKEYVKKNMHTFKNGYLFPNKTGRGRIKTETAGAVMAKWRKAIGKKYPEFLDHYNCKKPQIRYRIGWHSCRRWFETRIWVKYKDRYMLRDLMRYRDARSVDVYIDAYQIWEKERELLKDTFGDLFNDFQMISKNQTQLNKFF